MTSLLVVCTHNSARSQMSEGLAHTYLPALETHSAGTEKTRVHPLAIKAMKEIDIDISNHRSKTIDEFMDRSFDYVVTVCDRAKETCPYYPNAEHHLHKSFEDPSVATGTEEERLEKFREVRDQIKDWLLEKFSEVI